MKTVCVIGAGPAGLAAMKELQQAGLEVTAFDRSSSVGGRWSLDENRGVWKELCMNINRRLLSYSDFEWKASYYANHDQAWGGFYAHCTETKLYLDDYARHFDLHSSIQLQTNVQSVEQDDEGGWKVTTEPVQGGPCTTHSFDALVVCSGIQAVPRNPLADKFQAFTGQQLHSQYFRSIYDYKDQRVLVVGSGISGSEIAVALAVHGGCTRVCNSLRRMGYHVQLLLRDSQGALDDVIFRRFQAWLGRLLAESVVAKGAKSSLLELFPNQCTKELTGGFAPDEDFRKNVVCPSRYSYVDAVKDLKLHVVPSVDSVDGKKVTFTDGKTEEFDAVIFATGFDLDFSFLPKAVQDKVLFQNPYSGKQELSVHKLTLVPGMDNLAFCGCLYNFGPHFGMSEMQARWIAATFSGKMPRPSEAEIQAGLQADREYRSSARHHSNVYYNKFCEELGDILGVTPSYLEGVWNSQKYLFSGLYPCQYRTKPEVDGKETAAACQELFERYVANPQVGSGEEDPKAGRKRRTSLVSGY